MRHLDEGTIHAWLDGALSDPEARDVSAHAATCPQCGAMVAEARGLIAGASRILTSLDDAPSGVVPKRAVSAPARPQRFWQAAPWVTGIAAALMLAVGIKEWRDRPSAKAAISRAMPVAATFDSLRASVDSTLKRQLNVPLPQISTSKAAPAPAPRRATAVAEEAPKKDAVAEDVAADAVQPSAKLVPAAPSLGAASALAIESAPRRDEREFAGCYRIGAGPRESGLAAARAATPQRAPERRVAQPPAAVSAADASGMLTPEFVRLDTTNSPNGRLIMSGSRSIGTWRLEGDSLRLMMPVAGVRMVSRSSRVDCAPSESRP